MTKDEIIALAVQAGFDEHQAKFDTRIEALGNLVAAKEREACAKVCAELGEWSCVHAIEARGEQA